MEQHFDQVAQAVPPSTLASGLAEAFRSGQTAPFPQLASQLFANENGPQQAGGLNGLMAGEREPQARQSNPLQAVSPTSLPNRNPHPCLDGRS